MVMEQYIIGIDQSTQGTKALLVDGNGTIVGRVDKPHRQIINDEGWVSHDPEEIYQNVIDVISRLLETTNVARDRIVGMGISNQRETSLIWDRRTGEPLNLAVVWQCARATQICERIAQQDVSDLIYSHTGLRLSPYFPAAKLTWLLENTTGARELANRGELGMGTIDTWLVYRLTGGRAYKTDYSNASRTQLFHIMSLCWDEEICAMFGIQPSWLPEVCDSNSLFGWTDLGGLLDHPIPIHGVLGDSHGSLFGQGCLEPGMTKATYGTGSSIMMNIGEIPVLSTHGLVTSIAWGMDHKVQYVLEGNLNYTGASITWIKDDLHIIDNPGETEQLARDAIHDDTLYLVPAFSGLGAPYWNSHARAAFVGMSRTTGRNELVRATVESIAYQITDIVTAMAQDANIAIHELRVDGGPTRNRYLMQFQSDIANATVQVPEIEELSAIGPVYAAGLALGVWDRSIFDRLGRSRYEPHMDVGVRDRKYRGWMQAVGMVLQPCAAWSSR